MNITLTPNFPKLNSNLQGDGYVIKDGYDFLNADFNLNSISEKPNFTNKIQFKFINGQQDLNEFLTRQARTKKVYQFYFSAPISVNPETTDICK